MIEEATIQVAADGGVLVILPRTGMDPSQETRVCVRDGDLRVGQAGRCFVRAPLAAPSDAEFVTGNPDLTVVEVDEVGIEFHERAREAAI